jgi:hypothetical protein
MAECLVDEYGIELDVAADEGNSIVPKHLFDAFSEPWCATWFCNPPYSRIGPWVARAIDQSLLCGGIMLVPASVDTHWFHQAIESGRCRFWLFRGRIRFIAPPGTRESTPSIGNMLLEFSSATHSNAYAGVRDSVTGRIV